MSHYATEIKPATCYIHKEDFNEILYRIKKAAEAKCWNCYGWQKAVLNANTLEDVAKEFDIQLLHEYGNYYRPYIFDVYVSDFFKTLIEIMSYFMTNGKIMVNDEYSDVTIKYKNGSVKIKEV